jgi:CO/xanthine dehydrogenase FAD-binding subunit
MPFTVRFPSTPEEAIAEIGAPYRTAVLAGGTDLLFDLERARPPIERVVSLSRLPWGTLERREGKLRIGSTLPLRTLELDPRLATDLPGLAEAIRSVGSVPLRHRATIGGNLARASPASDLIPVLLALGASVRLIGPGGPRNVALDDFLVASRTVDLRDGELIEAIEVPERAACAYVWQRVRPANDISQVGVAVARPAETAGWTVALGGVVPRPVRVPAAEAKLRAAEPDAPACALAAEAAARDAPFTTDRRATEPYRRQLVAVLLRRALDAALGRERRR